MSMPTAKMIIDGRIAFALAIAMSSSHAQLKKLYYRTGQLNGIKNKAATLQCKIEYKK